MSVDNILRCHYDVAPYRDAVHRRNSGCFLLVLALTVASALNIVFTFWPSMNPSPREDAAMTDAFIAQVLDIFKTDKAEILEDIRNVYPDGLEMRITPSAFPRMTANRFWPVCFAAPQWIRSLSYSELWSRTGSCLDDKCFLRIDTLPSQILERLKKEKLAAGQRQSVLCSQLVEFL